MRALQLHSTRYAVRSMGDADRIDTTSKGKWASKGVGVQRIFGVVAQLGEHGTVTAEVVGSKPISPAIN